MDISLWTPDYWLENEEQCKTFLENNDIWKTIPSINYYKLDEFKNDCLIRFRGMVQDMYNPEYYYEKVQVINSKDNKKYIKTSKYRDTTVFEENEVVVEESEENVTSCRQTFVLITLPGINKWVEGYENEVVVKPRNENEQNMNKKRSLEDDEMEVDTNNSESCKKTCTAPSTSGSTRTENFVSKEHILNFPIEEDNGKCCHVKMYSDGDSIKLNEMIDIIGFLSLDPILTDPSYHNELEDNQMEIQTHNPPPSLVPRIHCVAFKKVDNCNPINLELNENDIEQSRKDLLIVLTQMLLGDELTAEYLICHLVSMIYMRNDMLSLGKFSVNISNVPTEKYPNYVQEIYEIIECLVPKSHYLPMTLENMNTLNFIPKKDYECNRLTSGLLQLSHNTHLVLDETKLQPGKLNESGCRAIAALSNIIKTQKVTYDFNYYQMEYESDIPILVLSEGKSLLPSDVHIPLKIDENCLETFSEIKEAAKHFLKPELLSKLRAYLSKTRHSTYTLSDETMELIQSEFVKMRQNGKMTADDLHHLLVLARLICLSYGKNKLDDNCWMKACRMEEERKQRLKK